MNISRKLILSIGSATLIAFLVTSYVIGNNSSNATRQLAYQLATEAARHHGQVIKTELEHSMGMVRALELSFLEMVDSGNTDRQLINKTLVSVVKDNPDSLLGAWMLWEPNAFDNRDAEFVNTPQHDHTGRVNSYWHWDDKDQVILENNVDWEDASWYNEPRKAEKPILLDPYVYKVSGVDTLLVSLIAPLMDNGQFRGVVGVDYKLSTLQDSISNVDVLDTGYATLIANDGTFLAHPDDGKVGTQLGEGESDRGILQFIRRGEQRVLIEQDPLLQEEAHIIYTPIIISGARAPWSLVVTIPSRTIEAPSRQLQQSIITSGFISLLVIIAIVAAFINHFVADPLQALEKAVKRFGQKDYKISVPVTSADEIGTLSTSFNTMAQQVDQSQQRLEAAEHKVRAMNEALEERVRQRTDELEQERDRANRANRSKSDFLANMSHEIRTPLNGVMGMVELLGDTQLSDDQKHYTRIIQSSGKTLLTVINDILDYSKIEADKLDVESAPLFLSDLVEDVVSPFRLLRNTSIRFIAYIDPDVPNHIRGDTVRLQQVLNNLLNNAFKFTQHGFIILRVSSETGAEQHLDSDQVTTSDTNVVLSFSLSDTGIGMSQEQQQTLFQPFSQADTSTTRKYGGSGLGLAICRKLINLMGGEISVTSEPNKGSTFHFSIPLATETDEPQPNLSADLNGKHLLVLDHLMVYQDVIARQAEALGMTITQVTSGAKLMEYLDACVKEKRHLPSVILSDLEIPNTDIHQLTRDLAKHPTFGRIPRVLMTSSTLKPDSELATHFDSCHYKSTSVEALRKVLSNTLSPAPETETQAPLADTSHLRELNLLVAEDNQINRMVAGGLLRKLGLEATFVEDGRQALSARKNTKGQIDLILMDCEMPEMDGYTATAKIREWERANDQTRVPIYALTAHVLPENLERCFEMGMDGRLAKPINAEKLLEVLEHIHTDRLTL